LHPRETPDKLRRGCCTYEPKATPLDTFYVKDDGPLAIWRQWAPPAQGQATKRGHFFLEENPYDTAILVKQFLST
jgi:hypothetical protein